MPPIHEDKHDRDNLNRDNLNRSQANFMDTINHGPDMLNPDLFDGPIDRIILGLKAHANTISHARLIALEETFPMTRESIGDEIFNQLSRDFIALDATKTRDNSQLGSDFDKFLEQRDIKATYTDLAAIEWAWLESYNAQDSDYLSLEQLSQFDEDALISQMVTWHPSVRLITLHDDIAAPLHELRDMTSNPISMMVMRPEVDVKLLPLDDITTTILQQAKYPVPIGNLLAMVNEMGNEDNPLQPLLTLIGSGVLICTD